MMPLNIGAIRTALADQIRVATNSSSLPANVYDYPPDSPQLNAILIRPAPAGDGNYVAYHGSFGSALCPLGFRIELRCGGGQIDAAKAMDLYLSSGNDESVFDALLADVTLGGVIQTLLVSGASPPAQFESSDPTDSRTWLSSSFSVEIRARR